MAHEGTRPSWCSCAGCHLVDARSSRRTYILRADCRLDGGLIPWRKVTFAIPLLAELIVNTMDRPTAHHSVSNHISLRGPGHLLATTQIDGRARHRPRARGGDAGRLKRHAGRQRTGEVKYPGRREAPEKCGRTGGLCVGYRTWAANQRLPCETNRYTLGWRQSGFKAPTHQGVSSAISSRNLVDVLRRRAAIGWVVEVIYSRKSGLRSRLKWITRRTNQLSRHNILNEQAACHLLAHIGFSSVKSAK